MSALMPCDDGWPVEIVPLQVGVLQLPIPSARRMDALRADLYLSNTAQHGSVKAYFEELAGSCLCPVDSVRQDKKTVVMARHHRGEVVTHVLLHLRMESNAKR